MTVTLIAAHSEDGIIARDGRIPWHLPDDIARFRKRCGGKWVLAGRRTWEQMDGWFQPGQTPVVVTRNTGLTVPGGHAAASVEAGLALAREQGAGECMVIGGGEIFTAAMPYADLLDLTEVHTVIGGGVRFPEIDPGIWEKFKSVLHEQDGGHPLAFSFNEWRRRGTQ